MTRKEAINELINLGNEFQIIPRTPKGEALLMAIQALEQDDKEGKLENKYKGIKYNE